MTKQKQDLTLDERVEKLMNVYHDDSAAKRAYEALKLLLDFHSQLIEDLQTEADADYQERLEDERFQIQRCLEGE